MEAISSTVSEVWTSLKRMNMRQFMTQGVNLGPGVITQTLCAACRWRLLTGDAQRPGLVVTSALIIWKSLMLFTGSESPVSLQ
jgi:hypothetical protein